MRRSMMASLVAIGGVVIAAMQMGRRRNRRNMWGTMLHSVTHSLNDAVRSSNHMWRSIRRRARI